MLKQSMQIAGFSEDVEKTPIQLEPVWKGSPFPGLRPFTDKDFPIFFGRGRETDELVGLLDKNRFTVVVGASGSGKSSLVWAGLIPRVNDRMLALRFTPGETGDDPFVALAVQLKPYLEQESWSVKSLAAHLALYPLALDSLCEQVKNRHEQVLLFIDQLEELFTVVRDDLLGPFVEMLTSIELGKNVRIAATLRSDFYPQCVAWPAIAVLMEKGHFPLSTPRTGALFEMIVRPSAIAGLEMESGLVQAILDDTGNEPGALALLAYTLDELYHSTAGTKLFTFEQYKALGGVQGAIGRRAEHTFNTLANTSQDTMPYVFRELVEVDVRGTAARRRASLAQIAVSEEAQEFIDAFVRARLLVVEGDSHRTTVEVAHEALFRNWERLKIWIEKVQADLLLLRQLRMAALQWDRHGRQRDFLWLGEINQEVQLMLERLKPKLNDIEQTFAKPEREHLLSEIDDPNTVSARRGVIGERLSVLEDPRRGVRNRPDGLPDIVWCAVPSGTITLEGKNFLVKSFYIAKYPITYEQFNAFLVATDGFDINEWWVGLPKDYVKQKMDTQNNRYNSHPREKVSWYQAVAFCRWLNTRCKALATNLSAADRGTTLRV